MDQQAKMALDKEIKDMGFVLLGNQVKRSGTESDALPAVFSFCFTLGLSRQGMPEILLTARGENNFNTQVVKEAVSLLQSKKALNQPLSGVLSFPTWTTVIAAVPCKQNLVRPLMGPAAEILEGNFEVLQLVPAYENMFFPWEVEAPAGILNHIPVMYDLAEARALVEASKKRLTRAFKFEMQRS